MTQAQGGGRRGCSTRDHLFILRGAMAHAIKNGIDLFITYYDVAKAYDRADVEDMLVAAWEHGLKGKVWRLMTQLVWMRAGVLMMRARRVKTAPVTALLQCLHKSDGVLAGRGPRTRVGEESQQSGGT